LGIGDWGLGPIPNPQSPIPNYNLKTVKILKTIKTIKTIKAYKKFKYYNERD